jgi:hypothetical protein
VSNETFLVNKRFSTAVGLAQLDFIFRAGKSMIPSERLSGLKEA